MKTIKEAMALYAVTDRSWLGGRTLEIDVEKSLKGGVTCLQLREKELQRGKFIKEAIEIKKLCDKYEVPLIINDDVEVAIKSNAWGVHIGQEDMNAGEAREQIGDKMVMGVSVQNVDQALEAEKMGADYLGVGAVFSTSTKLDADNVSHTELKNICQQVNIPVVAIGGITKENMVEFKGSGIDGVALISSIFSKDDIEKECRELRILWEDIKSSDK